MHLLGCFHILQELLAARIQFSYLVMEGLRDIHMCICMLSTQKLFTFIFVAWQFILLCLKMNE